LDAVAVGQFTPGPFLSSDTFLCYQIAGLKGAAVATLEIMIPSFIFVLMLNPIIPRLRKSKVFSKFLDAVSISAIAIMLIVGIKLMIEVLIDLKTIIFAILSSVVFLKYKKVNSAYIIIGAALIGYLFK